MGYFRLWASALDQSYILKNTHNWLRFQNTSRRRKKDHSGSLPTFRRRSDVAEDVMVPSMNASDSLSTIIIDLSICELTRLKGAAIPCGNANSPGASTLRGKYGWRVHPPLYFGLERVYPTPTNKDLITTAAPSHIAKAWDWKPLRELSEQVRSRGKITVHISWLCASPQESASALDKANHLVMALSSKQFCQDWAVDFNPVFSSPSDSESKVSVSKNSFFRACLHHFDEFGAPVQHTVYSESVGVVDIGQFLQRIEAFLRDTTRQSNRLLHAHLRTVFRSKLWGEEFSGTSESVDISKIFLALGGESRETSIEELLVHQHAALPAGRRARAHVRIIQSEFDEGLWVAGVLSDMPNICEYAIKMAMRRGARKTPNVSLAAAAASSGEVSAEDGRGVHGKDHRPGLVENATAANTKIQNDESMEASIRVLGRGENVRLCQPRDEPSRLVSYSLVVTWETYTRGHVRASLEATCGIDAYCLFLDGRYVPVETLNRLNTHTVDTSGRCQGTDQSPLQLFQEYEKSSSGIVIRSQRFDFDLNMVSRSVQSLAVVLGANASQRPSAFKSCKSVTLRLERVHHSEKSFRRLAFERRRKTGGTNDTMNDITNLQARVVTRRLIGEAAVTGKGSSQSATLLCTFQRIKSAEWSFNLEMENMHGTATRFEQIYHASHLQHKMACSRRPCVDIVHCCGCENHQRTSWHLPGQFEHLFEACKAAILKAFPRIIVRGIPSIERIGAFEVIYRRHEASAKRLLYSALDDQGWLPTPSLVVERIFRVQDDSVSPSTRPPDSDDKEDVGFGKRAGATYSHRASPVSPTRPPRASFGSPKIQRPSPFVVQNSSPISVRKRDAPTSVLSFSVRDALSNLSLRNAAVCLFSVSSLEDMRLAASEFKMGRISDLHVESPEDDDGMSGIVKERVLYTSARGRCEGEFDACKTYCVQVESQGYYPYQISGLRVAATERGRSTGRKSESTLLRSIALMPLIERVDLRIRDLESGENINAGGIKITLVNRRTATRHTGVTDINGTTSVHVPHGSYRIQVSPPLFDEIPYALTSDKSAMSFIETATAFDKARRDAFAKKEMRITIQGEVEHSVGIPSMRWPWHFTVLDGSTGKPLRGVKFQVKNRAGSNIFVSKSSGRGTASGMIELGAWARIAVTKEVQQDGTRYLPFEESLLGVERKRSPLLVKVMLCPQPRPKCGRAILSWSRRCWIDLHVRVKSLATTGGKQTIHIWRKCISGGGVTLDLPSEDGHGPTSCSLKLLPLAEYRFSAVQHGSFKANRQSMITLASAKPELLLCNSQRIVAHVKHEESTKMVVGERWTDAVVIRTNDRCEFVCDERSVA